MRMETARLYFAIGDIHGESVRLKQLHAAILDRIAFEGRPARIVHLGDYIDRGPDSRGVIEQIMALQARYDDDPAIDVIALMGNHEEMMLNQKPERASAHWLDSGGVQTLESYGEYRRNDVTNWVASIPKAHLRWLANLPTFYYDEPRRLAFVHAGIDPKTFPDCRDEVRLWTRSDKFMRERWPEREELKGLTVIHGHTPTDTYEPDVFANRINVDTGAVYGGPLTAVMLKDGAAPQFLRID
jgi:serine/threonine protein phosphatase 1